LLKQLRDETTTLPNAMTAIQQAKEMIAEVEALLPDSPKANFRERLVERLEELQESDTDLEFQRKASELLILYEKVFGVKDVVDMP
jgi:hypothetical protein